MRILTFFYILGGVAALSLLYLAACYVCFRLTFYVSRRKRPEYDLPPGKVYEPYYDRLRAWIDASRAIPHEDVYITSHDGLRLHGAYYECDPDAPVEILIHGYRGSAERDMAAGVERCFAMGRNALLVNQRAASKSEGRVITFGAREHRDCLAWVDYLVARFGNEKKIILTGISMGAATVMLAAGEPLPENVVCVLADCGYSSAPAIIKKVLKTDLKLPVWLFYPLIRVGGILYGGFDVERISPARAMARATVPVIFIHGDNDLFVPHTMSEECFAACASEKKKLVIIHDAGHALAFPFAPDAYYKALYDFQKECNF